MLYYIKYAWPFVRKKDYKRDYRFIRRWINYNTINDPFGSHAHYLDEDKYRIWIDDPRSEKDSLDL